MFDPISSNADSQDGLATLFTQLVKPGIKKLVNEMFTGVHYLLNQAEYDELLVEEVVPRRFALDWDSLIMPFKVFPFTLLLIVA